MMPPRDNRARASHAGYVKAIRMAEREHRSHLVTMARRNKFIEHLAEGRSASIGPLRVSPRIEGSFWADVWVTGDNYIFGHGHEALWKEQEGLCGICSKPIDASEMFSSGKRMINKHGNEVTLARPIGIDHIVPQSRDGWNIPANERLTHRSCNSRKNARFNPLENIDELEALVAHLELANKHGFADFIPGLFPRLNAELVKLGWHP